MSKCIYREIANKLDKEVVEEYYKTHLPKDVCNHFNFNQFYFIRIFNYLGIKRRTPAENTKIQFKYYNNTNRNLKVSQSNKGRIVSEETKKKISQSNLGIKKSKTKTT